ncbi:MAG: glycosyltransferase [Candidatus Omnitrophota bacterium]
MNILMMSNTYIPLVGGVERSISTFSEAMRSDGHNVLIVTPELRGQDPNESGVLRLPSIHRVKDTDFSLNLPLTAEFSNEIREFKPDIVHSHHPFLLGDSAQRIAARHGIPIVFTYHTIYEQKMHYLDFDTEQSRRFIKRLAVEYANHCDAVVTPTKSIGEHFRSQGMKTPTEVIPTGIDMKTFGHGDRGHFRKTFNIPEDAFVVSHIGRMVKEKNVDFLTRCVLKFMEQKPDTHYLLVGGGPSLKEIKEQVSEAGLSGRVTITGNLDGQDLIDGYHAGDVFGFASHSETQGLVLLEAMAAGLPVIGVDAFGTRDFVESEKNGKVIPEDDDGVFADALSWYYQLDDARKKEMRKNARDCAKSYSIGRCTERMLNLYRRLIQNTKQQKDHNDAWQEFLSRAKTEWNIMKGLAKAGDAALSENES